MVSFAAVGNASCITLAKEFRFNSAIGLFVFLTAQV
jgi:hypothetical protein